jgi:hypothetical protein
MVGSDVHISISDFCDSHFFSLFLPSPVRNISAAFFFFNFGFVDRLY